VHSRALQSPGTLGKGIKQLLRASASKLRDAGCRLEEVVFSNQLSGVQGIDGLVSHRPVSKAALGDRFADYRRHARVARIPNDALEYFVNVYYIPLEDLEEASLDVQQHPCEATRGVVGA